MSRWYKDRPAPLSNIITSGKMPTDEELKNMTVSTFEELFMAEDNIAPKSESHLQSAGEMTFDEKAAIDQAKHEDSDGYFGFLTDARWQWEQDKAQIALAKKSAMETVAEDEFKNVGRDTIKLMLDEKDAALAKVNEEVERLTVELARITCGYCGALFERDWSELQEHIKTCEKHPLFQANLRIAELQSALELSTELIDKYAGPGGSGCAIGSMQHLFQITRDKINRFRGRE